MAVKWLIRNGSISSSANWNDGTLPQAGDICYLNGYDAVISVNTAFDIGNGEVRNDLCPNTGKSGGRFNQTLNNASIIASKIVCGSNYIIALGINSITLSADLYTPTSTNECAIRSTSISYNNGITINGNVHFQGGGVFDYTTNTRAGVLTINGNVVNTLTTPLVKRTTNGSTLTINGNLPTLESEFCNYPIDVSVTDTLETSLNMSNFQALTIGGNLIVNNSKSVVCDSLTISGHITYSGTNIDRGLSTSYINIVNPPVFYWENTLEQPVDYPQPEDVRKNITYDFGNKVGTMEQEIKIGCVTPEDVRKDAPLFGMGVVGSLVVPSVDDVREGVIFDNGSVGTLIVQGGGERLRIADFGYYTNAQSDTYIVDLTEQDKPKFAVAEERVLIEMFPDLDLDNIPEKYFDDLFVKYLKYRLIVEYYRTAGINSTFTPSEPTTEIVNYQNVRNEVWLNSANIYLKAWGKKYPNSIKEHRIIL